MSSITYVPYHMHTELSNGTTNIDSITNFKDYVEACKACGIKALGISEHGNTFHWLHKKEAIEDAGMKYLHCVEAYITEDNEYVEIKSRDNYHCVLIAKNYEGVKELNILVSNSYNRNDYHFYYMPRISMSELMNTSDNIIITTACLGGVINKGSDRTRELFICFLARNKDRCFLEIQHHNIKEQIEYNKYLYNLSKTINVPLIVGTDTHALNSLHMDGRHVLQKAKNVNFADEDYWDLTFKTPEELVKAYKEQDSLPMDVIYEAMANTVRMADMVEEFKLDYSPKYPKLYEDSEAVFKKKVNDGTIWRGIHKLPNKEDYYKRIHYEYDTYKHNNAIDFMLLEEDYKSEMRRKGIRFGYSRGSVSGSIIAYLLGITEIDSLKFNLNFERFMNTERVSLADIDTDWYSEDRKAVKDYLYGKEGLYCCDIVTFNTIALKGAIRDVIRGLYRINVDKLEIPEDLKERIKKWEKSIEGHDARDTDVSMPKDIEKEFNKYYSKGATYKDVPYDYMKFTDEVIALTEEDEAKARRMYKTIFKYVDLLNGVVVSVGNHPAGCVVSPFPVDEWFGTFTTKTNEYPISVLNMKEIDSLNFVKLDILGLDNVGLIYKTCDLAGIPYATPDNVPADDEEVWKSIREDTTMIFQWESPSATAYLNQLLSDSTIQKIRMKNPDASYMDLLSIGNGAIRPAGESYRDKLANGEYATYGNEALDDFLKPTLGWLVYQEQIIEFLHSFCGYTMGEADIVRRGFAKKTGTEKFIPKIKKGFAKTMMDKYNVPPEESDKIIVSFIKVIEDASSYLFSKNHADPYSWIGYICGYLRYYYPLEFITTALNIFANKEDKSIAIIDYAKKKRIKISPIKFRHSTSEYSFDKETNQIFKGIASIKYLNAQIADDMYKLRNNTYNSFTDLLFDITEKTTVNSRQLKILIELDFFEEFGDANKLLQEYKVFDLLNGRLQIKKDSIEQMGLQTYIDIIKECAEKETEKMFAKFNSRKFLSLIADKLPYRRRTLKEKMEAQIEHLGYIDIVDDKYSGLACVVSLNTKYAPKLKMYSLKYGNVLDCKIDRKTFNSNKLSVGDVVGISGSRNKPKVRKNENGEFVPIEGTSELWITSYKKVNNL